MTSERLHDLGQLDERWYPHDHIIVTVQHDSEDNGAAFYAIQHQGETFTGRTDNRDQAYAVAIASFRTIIRRNRLQSALRSPRHRA